jgi:hypothetical protein
VAAFGAALPLAACGGGSSSTTTSTQPPANLPNIAQIETAIAGTIQKDDHVSARVLCPSTVPELSGETFACIGIATVPRAQTFQFLVTEHGGTFVTYARTA